MLKLSLVDTKLCAKSRSMLIFYFISLNKPEFTQFAQKIAKKTNKDLCYATAWALVSSMDYETTSPNKYYDDILLFLKDYCTRNNEKISDWLLNQMKDFQ